MHHPSGDDEIEEREARRQRSADQLGILLALVLIVGIAIVMLSLAHAAQ